MRSFKKYILESDTKEGYYKHSIWLSRSYLRELPDFLSGITIGGGFDVSNNQLTSCKNFPMYIAGSIAISSNNIESLEGLPLELNSTLLAQHNKLKHLNKDDIHIVYMGGVDINRGIGMLLESLRFLSHNYICIIIGDGPSMREIKVKYKHYIENGRLRMLGNIINEEIPALLKVALT